MSAGVANLDLYPGCFVAEISSVSGGVEVSLRAESASALAVARREMGTASVEIGVGVISLLGGLTVEIGLPADLSRE